jgi:uncharacterized protein
VTLFEADDRLGGHAHTHDVVEADGSVLGVDTGFIALEQTAATDGGSPDAMTLAEFLAREKFSSYFISHFMTPVVSAVWSCDPTTALAYPARYLFTVLRHHGLLGISGSPKWRTVTGGSRTYVDKLAATLPDVRLSSPVTSVRRHTEGIELATAQGKENFDAVVIATHPGQALRMLADASPEEKNALGNMPYSVNHTVFHRDEAVLPSSGNAMASWNYRLPARDARPDKVLVSYDMTRLHRLTPADGRPYIVSLGESELIADDTVLDRMVYEHPQYTPDSLRAQRQILTLGDGRLAFAGAYHGRGFHEDGALSGVNAAARLGRGWERQPAVSNTAVSDPGLESVAAEGS